MTQVDTKRPEASSTRASATGLRRSLQTLGVITSVFARRSSQDDGGRLADSADSNKAEALEVGDPPTMSMSKDVVVENVPPSPPQPVARADSAGEALATAGPLGDSAVDPIADAPDAA